MPVLAKLFNPNNMTIVIGGFESRGLTKGPPTVGTKMISPVEIPAIPGQSMFKRCLGNSICILKIKIGLIWDISIIPTRHLHKKVLQEYKDVVKINYKPLEE